jgi:hypothetical protein
MQKLIILAMLLVAMPAFGFQPDKVAHFASSGGYGLVTGTIIYHYVKQMGPVERMLIFRFSLDPWDCR